MRIDDRLFGALVCLLGIAVLWHSAGFPAVAGQFYGPMHWHLAGPRLRDVLGVRAGPAR